MQSLSRPLNQTLFLCLLMTGDAKTPNFDKLAKTGLILHRHYIFKVCSPLRVSFLTGRWPHHVHQFNILTNYPLGTNVNMTILLANLKQAGYSTHLISKWHASRLLPGEVTIREQGI